MLMLPGLAAGFYRTSVTPKWLINMYTAFTPHFLLITAQTAQDTASGFNHYKISFLISIIAEGT
jgi:hypothetical protein